jgi:sugar phosphate isomerase/epimerase
MEITALIGAWSGPNEWNFMRGPLTLGIVPPAYRAMRLKELESSARFAKRLGVCDVCTHFGFIPECPSEPLYAEVLAAVRYLCNVYKNLGRRINMETGQETPVTLLRILRESGADNIGLNFDPANLLMYGKANPVDALDIVGSYVNGVHAKDGEYPTNAIELGLEKPLGQGRVNFSAFIKKLIALGYDGALTIEREISGEQQKTDVITANRLLLDILKKEEE